VPTQAKYVLLIFILSFSRAVKKMVTGIKKSARVGKMWKIKKWVILDCMLYRTKDF
jgi:hypothetical protein